MVPSPTLCRTLPCPVRGCQLRAILENMCPPPQNWDAPLFVPRKAAWLRLDQIIFGVIPPFRTNVKPFVPAVIPHLETGGRGVINASA